MKTAKATKFEVKGARERAGHSVQKAAFMAGVTVPEWLAYERGEKSIPVQAWKTYINEISAEQYGEQEAVIEEF